MKSNKVQVEVKCTNAGKVDLCSQRLALFNELHAECRNAAPGATLSHLLRTKLEKYELADRQKIVNRCKDKCTPLFIACKRGNVDIVEYLIQECNADFEDRGTYEVPDDNSTHYVTPLWCASVAGHLPVVKCLVLHGATVNNVSDTGSTPVRSACFMTHFNIVQYLVEHGADILKPNLNGGTCLINSVQSVPLCEYLLKHGAAVNAQDIQLKTALHYAIQEHRLETTKLLLDYNADPLIRSRAGDDALQMACLKGAVQIFAHLITLKAYTMERVADAYDLMGATYLDEHHDIPLALQFWRQALKHRTWCKGVGDKASQLSPLARKVYNDAVEFNTFEELDNLIADLDALRIQSLLINERVLGPLHKDTIFRLMYRGAAYADNGFFQRCVDLWMYALSLRIAKDGILHTEVGFTAQALVRLFLDLMSEQSHGGHEKVQFQDVVDCTRLLVDKFPEALQLLNIRPVFKRQQDNFHNTMGLVIYLFYILLSIPEEPGHVEQTKRLINAVIQMNPRDELGHTLLHLACTSSEAMKTNGHFERDYTDIFPSEDVMKALLECGLNANVVNLVHDTPLHLAVKNSNIKVAKLLLRQGAHIDMCNDCGVYPHRMMRALNECDVNWLQYLNLQCLAAQTIRQQKIPYVGEIPIALEEFVKLH